MNVQLEPNLEENSHSCFVSLVMTKEFIAQSSACLHKINPISVIMVSVDRTTCLVMAKRYLTQT